VIRLATNKQVEHHYVDNKKSRDNKRRGRNQPEIWQAAERGEKPMQSQKAEM